jgi:hypothetical protein
MSLSDSPAPPRERPKAIRVPCPKAARWAHTAKVLGPAPHDPPNRSGNRAWFGTTFLMLIPRLTTMERNLVRESRVAPGRWKCRLRTSLDANAWNKSANRFYGVIF